MIKDFFRRIGKEAGMRMANIPLMKKWMFSYISVLLLPILICSFFYAHTYKTLKEASVSNQLLLLENATQQIDYVVYDSVTLINNLVLNNNVQNLSYTKTSIAPNPILERHFLSQELRSYQSANTLLQDIIIYFPVTDYIVTTSSAHQSSLVEHMENQPITFDKLTSLYQTLKENDIYCFLSTDQNSLLIAHPLITHTNDGLLSIVILKIDKQKLTERLKNHLLPESKCNFTLIDQNSVLLTTDTDETLKDLPAGQIWEYFQNNPDTTYEIKIPSGPASYMVNFYPSLIPNVGLISVTEKSAYNITLYQLLSILCATLILCIFLGLIITYYYSKRNYQPVEKIVKYIADTSKETKDVEDYQLIMQALRQNHSEIEYQRSIMRNDYLLKLLTGEVPVAQISEQISSQFSLSLTAPYSCVIQLLILEKTENDKTNHFNSRDNNNDRLIYFIIQNILAELLSPCYPNHYFCIQQNKIGLLVNLSHQENLFQKFSMDIKAILENISALLDNHYEISFFAGIGNILPNESIPTAWLQADNTVEYLRLFEKEAIQFYCEVPLTSQIGALHLNTPDYVQNLLFSSSEEQFDAYFQTLQCEIANSSLSVADVKSCFYYFYHITANVKYYCQKYYDFTPISLNFSDNQYFSLSLQDALQQIQNSYREFRKEYAHFKQHEIQDRRELEIRHFIENNYFDINLNLNIIAEHFSISPSYLSKKFKEKNGKGINDYLYEIRISHAMHLLNTTNLKVAEIAEMTGFQDSNAFIRIFKKYVGTTPGKYQNSPKPDKIQA